MASKTIRKRIKVTKTGKLLRRQKGLGHSRAKKSRNLMRKKTLLVEVSGSDKSNMIHRLKK
ncbi:MAG: 50S ribosomal protein L35 [Candidatus Colwellbacteria bacterium CG10_big_fil_rev_8_21_14_0_10_41_28]|uniref:50S ribosomal protein L35 n=1 Tax=Candidatus Colwellbacteria bacterium CG10_big_fil_rev_8_21_14_0_10_41_28 TaxID=1974539 RepID=A0A2H0VHS0_9BACT|nr:MAG: 50S ribosomal protein L35 [Candidatus Colwellbacteria bacterium CG10_big_fil_rev_8_21_14_0_10_41_28]